MSDEVEELTQEMVDEMVKQAREKWAEDVKASGKPQALYVAGGGKAVQVLAYFKEFEDHVREAGFECPQIIEGVTVFINCEE